MSSFVDLEEFLVGYLAETEEHLSASNTHLVALEAAARRGLHAPAAVRGLFRSLHTIKGLSAMVGVEPVVELAHAMEALLRVSDRRGAALSPRALELLSDGVAAVEQRVRAFGARRQVPAAPAALVQELSALELPTHAEEAGERLSLQPEIGDKVAASERQQIAQALHAGRRVALVEFVPSPARAATGVNITSVRERMGSLGEIVKVVPLSRAEAPSAPSGLVFALLIISDASDEALVEAAGGPPAALQNVTLAPSTYLPEPESAADASVDTEPTRAGVVRVPVARLDDALEKLSALVVNRYRLGRAIAVLADRGVDVRAVNEVLAESSRALRDLRGAILRARTVPMTEVLDRVPLLVRGLERTTRKRVTLELLAGRAELDKAVAERLMAAIVHLVRNAIDHGLEQADERRQTGKPAEGVLRIAAGEVECDQLELTIADDGRGIDRAQVAARAGRRPPEDDEELLQLLALPGVSTREKADTTSGRGMGIDIVQRIVAGELGGQLSVRSEPGRGTTFTVRVPLSITILDAFSFLCGAQPFVVPVSSVEEIVEIDASTTVTGPRPEAGDGAVVRLLSRRGETVPLIRLAELLAARGGSAAAAARAPQAAAGVLQPKAIVVRRGQQPYAFEVDRMLGQQEVVVRPIADPLVRRPGVSGAVDLGDGRPTLMLDLLALSAAMVSRREVTA